ncbi:MAG: DUF2071 domain-containing protein [Verrucomicrobiota bacterium]
MSIPTLEQREEACCPPAGQSVVMFQKWRDLLFLHWEISPDELQRTLPEGLTVDTHEGKAYLGVVPFFMEGIRPRFCPVVPGLSSFLELNLRTYVYDRHGRPGVWFYSLDATQWLAVRIARTLFNLPYFDANMTAERGTEIDYKSSRKGCSDEFDCHYLYAAKGELPNPEPGSLEYFLVERYYLFAANKAGRLFSGRVHHTPYPLHDVDFEVRKEGTMALAGFGNPKGPPDHAVMSKGVEVRVFAIQPVR